MSLKKVTARLKETAGQYSLEEQTSSDGNLRLTLYQGGSRVAFLEPKVDRSGLITGLSVNWSGSPSSVSEKDLLEFSTKLAEMYKRAKKFYGFK